MEAAITAIIERCDLIPDDVSLVNGEIIACVAGMPLAGFTDIAKTVSLRSKYQLLGIGKDSEVEVNKWIAYLKELFALSANPGQLTRELHKFNKTLLTCTFLVDEAATAADFMIFTFMHSIVSKWNDNERGIFCNITRWFDNLQHMSGNSMPLIDIAQVLKVVPRKPAPPKPAAVAQGKGKGKQAPAAPADNTPAIARVSLRVGRIVEAVRHEASDHLYKETVDLGEPEPRSVCSGLAGLIDVEALVGRLGIFVCNLKPMKMKGVPSQAMLLVCVQRAEGKETFAELVEPPEGAKVGERVTFDGFPGEADAQLNPKKKIWESVVPELRTTANGVAAYRNVPFATSAGPCRVRSLVDTPIS